MPKASTSCATRTRTDLPEDERFDLNLHRYRRGLAARQRGLVLAARPHRLGAGRQTRSSSDFSGFVDDSGEGRWTIEAAIEEAVPADVLSAALYTRFRSRQEHTFGEKMLSAMRFGFGGHVEGAEATQPPATAAE